jgi:hypothetical protein
MEDNNSFKGTFLSAGGGYKAPYPRKADIKEIIQYVRQCRDELTRNVITLQQAALEQERLEAYYEQLAAATKTLIEVTKELEVGTELTSEWIQRRDEASKIIHMIIGEAQQEKSQEQK